MSKKKLWQKRWFWPAVCYVVAILTLFVSGLHGLLREARMRASGEVQMQQLTVQDFELTDLVLEDGHLRALEDDPQMCYTVPEGQKVLSLTVQVSYDHIPYERCVYYVAEDGQAFGQDRRAWAKVQPDGSLYYRLPVNTRAIRFDPASYPNIQMEFTAITLNAVRPSGEYFVPTGTGAFALVVLPALAAAVLQWLTDVGQAVLQKDGKIGGESFRKDKKRSQGR